MAPPSPMVPVWDADETGPKRNRLAGASKRTRLLVRVVDVIKVGGLTTARDQPDGVTLDELYRRDSVPSSRSPYGSDPAEVTFYNAQSQVIATAPVGP
jgi:hypothetical protein